MLDLVLQLHKAFEKGFRTRRAAADVNVHWEEAINSLQDRVAAIHAAGRGAGAHGNYPFWLRHLVVDPFDCESHLISDSASDDHDVRLPRRKPHHFCAEASDIKTSASGGHHLNRATGEAHWHGPKRI